MAGDDDNTVLWVVLAIFVTLTLFIIWFVWNKSPKKIMIQQDSYGIDRSRAQYHKNDRYFDDRSFSTTKFHELPIDQEVSKTEFPELPIDQKVRKDDIDARIQARQARKQEQLKQERNQQQQFETTFYNTKQQFRRKQEQEQLEQEQLEQEQLAKNYEVHPKYLERTGTVRNGTRGKDLSITVDEKGNTVFVRKR